MLKISETEKKILDGLLTASPAAVAANLGIPRKDVYDVKHRFLKKVQNAEEFLSVAKSKYAPLRKRRLNTPRIMPINPEDELEITKHQKQSLETF